MAERLVTWVDGVQAGTGREMRLTNAGLLVPVSALVARGGVLHGYAVTAKGTPDMSVDVAAGQAAVVVTETAPGGVAMCTNDATVNKTIAAADPTNPRIDLVIARVYAELTPSASRKWAIEVVAGTPHATDPQEPTLPANSLKLRAVTVGAGVSSITSSAISTTLPARTSALGGITPSKDATDVVGFLEGQYRHRLDTGALEQYRSGAWKPPWNLPWGRIGRADVGVSGLTAALATISNGTLTNGTTVGRRVILRGSLRLVRSGVVTQGFAVLNLDGAASAEYPAAMGDAEQSTVSLSVEKSSTTTVSPTWSIAIRADGGGQVRSEVGVFYFEDLGPA